MTGFTQLADGLDIMTRIARPDARLYSVESWRALSPFVIDKGDVKIFPLAGVTGDDPSAQEQFARLEKDVAQAGIHFFGGDMHYGEQRVSPEEGYGRQLARGHPRRSSDVHLAHPRRRRRLRRRHR